MPYTFLQFSDKLEGMIETLTTTAEQVDKAEPISAHPDKLKDQILDNQAIVEDLDKRLTALEAVASTAEELLSQAGMDDEAAKGELFPSILLYKNGAFVWSIVTSKYKNQ